VGGERSLLTQIYRSRATAIGRKQPFKTVVFSLIECPVSVKADIQKLASELSTRNDRFTPGSSRSAIMAVKGRL